jgi:hypothetical protein
MRITYNCFSIRLIGMTTAVGYASAAQDSLVWPGTDVRHGPPAILAAWQCIRVALNRTTSLTACLRFERSGICAEDGVLDRDGACQIKQNIDSVELWAYDLYPLGRQKAVRHICAEEHGMFVRNDVYCSASAIPTTNLTPHSLSRCATHRASSCIPAPQLRHAIDIQLPVTRKQGCIMPQDF